MANPIEFLTQRFAIIEEGTDESIYHVSNEVNEFCSTIDAFPPLIEILKSSDRKYNQKLSILLIKRIFLSVGNEFLDQNLEIWNEIYQILYQIPNQELKNDILSNIIDVFKNPSHFQVVIKYIFEPIQSNSIVNLLTSQKILLYFASLTDEIASYDEQVMLLVQKGIEIGGLTQIMAIRAALEYFNTFDDTTRSVQMLELIPRLVTSVSDNDFSELCNLIIYLADNEYINYNPEATFEFIVNTVSEESLNLKRRNFAASVLSSLFENYEAFGQSIEHTQAAFQAILALAQAGFSESESRDMSMADIFTICQYFAIHDDSVLSSFMELFPELSNSALGAFCICEFVINTTANSNFYANALGDLMPLLIDFLEVDSLCVVESTCAAISSIAEAVEGNIEPFVNDIYSSFTNVLQQNPCKELLSAFKELLKNVKNTDVVFDTAMQIMVEMLEICQVSDQQIILGVIAELVIGASSITQEQFDAVFSLYNMIIQDPNSPLLTDAVYIIGHLSRKAPELFEPYVPEVVSFLSNGFSSDNETILVHFINAFGYIAEQFAEQLYESIGEYVALFANISQGPTCEDGVTRKPADFALRWGCNLMSIFPETFLPNSDTFLEQIRAKSNIHAAIASEFFARATKALESEELVKEIQTNLAEILIPMSKNSDVETLGHVFNTVALIFGNLETQTQSVFAKQSIKCFTFQHRALLSKRNQYLQELHPMANEVLNMALTVPELIPLFSERAPLIIEYLSSNDLMLADGELVVLSNIVSHEQGSSPEILSAIFQAASQFIARDSYAAYYAIGRLARSGAPEVAQNAREIYTQLKTRLQRGIEESNSDPDFLMANDNCLSALCALIMSNPSSFNVNDYIHVVLQSMPLKADIDENEYVLSFFEGLYSSVGSEFHKLFFNVLANLFTESVEQLTQENISEEMIQRLIAIFQNLCANTRNAQELISQMFSGNDAAISNVFSVLGVQ